MRALILLVSLILASANWAAVLPTNAVVGGKHMGEWSVAWWQWAYATPTNQNPLVDLDGTWAHRAQPGGEVFFVGSVSGLQPPPISRTFSVPADRYLFFPLLMVNADNIDTVPPWTVEELRDAAASVILNPEELFLVIDGLSVSNLVEHRAISPVFSLDLPDPNNLKTLQNGHAITNVDDPVVSDGYWVMLEPLPPGRHVLRFGGDWPELTGFLPIDITATITAVPDYVVPTNAMVVGQTMEEWTAEWWKWAFSVSTNRHPLLDPDGSWAHQGQPGGEVFFLAGTTASLGYSGVTRSFSVPENKHLFFPLVNFWSDNVFTEPPFSIAELRDMNAGLVNRVTNLHASIDGVPVPADLFGHRAISPVFNFEFTTADNLESFAAGQPFTGLNDPIVSDGFWLMLEPLPPGRQVIRFGGSTGPPWPFDLDITDIITVAPTFSGLTRAHDGSVRLTYQGLPGRTCVLQASTNLADWLPIATNLVSTTPLEVVDPAAANFPSRYYRALEQP